MAALTKPFDIVSEFAEMNERARELFAQLRHAPQYSINTSYFSQAFASYTAIWKFQQLHRDVLVADYKLSRWQIGDIASKIAQLYYHYYLRTSDLSALTESNIFYEAIRERGYFSNLENVSPEIYLKKLRFYARYIVVLILCRKIAFLKKNVIREFETYINAYRSQLTPDDAEEWDLALREIVSLISVDETLKIKDTKANSEVIIDLSFRHHPSDPSVVRPASALILKEAIVVSGKREQARFSEITIDMLRISQCLEMSVKEETGPVRKSLLFRPSVSHFLAHLANATKDLPENSMILLYFSVDEIVDSQSNRLGLALSDQEKMAKNGSDLVGVDDLIPFTRYPLFLIIDLPSAAQIFKGFQSRFSQTLVCLFASSETPKNLEIRADSSSLLTIFLTCPITGICVLTQTSTLSKSVWEEAQLLLGKFRSAIIDVMTKSRSINFAWNSLIYDRFSRRFAQYFFIYAIVARLHTSCKTAACQPQSIPVIPDDIIENPVLHDFVFQLAKILDVRDDFDTTPINKGTRSE